MHAEKTIIITGGNATLGYQAAKTIAKTDATWHVVIAARDLKKGQAAAQKLATITNNPHFSALALNLASLDSVRRFVDTFLAQDLPPLHAIIGNAGVMTSDTLQYTEDGFELTFGVNYLGHFLLVNLLLPHLIAPARIVMVSGAHGKKTWLSQLLRLPPPQYNNARDAAFPPMSATPVSGRVRYATSKLANLYFTYELARHFAANGKQDIAVNAFNPGVMPGTRLSRDLPPMQQYIGKYILPLFQNRVPGFNSTERAGRALAQLITDPALQRVKGKYYLGAQESTSSEESYDREKAAELWRGSFALVGIERA